MQDRVPSHSVSGEHQAQCNKLGTMSRHPLYINISTLMRRKINTCERVVQHLSAPQFKVTAIKGTSNQELSKSSENKPSLIKAWLQPSQHSKNLVCRAVTPRFSCHLQFLLTSISASAPCHGLNFQKLHFIRLVEAYCTREITWIKNAGVKTEKKSLLSSSILQMIYRDLV